METLAGQMRRFAGALAALACAALAAGCAAAPVYRNAEMDFGSIQNVAVMPILNLSKDNQAAERVRDVINTMTLATGAFYVLPNGEVSKAVAKAGVADPTSPTAEETVKLCAQMKVDALFTGILREYGEVRSGSVTTNVISLSLKLSEGQTGKVVWSGSSTKGGVGFAERLFGGGGDPLNVVTEKAVDDLLNQLFGRDEESEE